MIATRNYEKHNSPSDVENNLNREQGWKNLKNPFLDMEDAPVAPNAHDAIIGALLLFPIVNDYLTFLKEQKVDG